MIRPARMTDASSIAAISMEVWIGTYLKNGVNGFFADYALTEFTTAKTEALLADPSQTVLVSENSEGIDGFIRVTADCPAPDMPSCTTEIATLYVQPRHHGKGIGAALLDAGCKSLGTKSVWLTTNSENHPAIRFYLSQGFEQVGETFFEIGDEKYPNVILRRSGTPRPA